MKKISPIFSLADPITIRARVDEFELYGESHDGQHVVVFFRPVVDSELLIDYRNPLALNRFCKLYNFINTRGTVYGHLFVINDAEKMQLSQHKLIVRCNVKEHHDFQLVPISSGKQKLQLFKSSSGCLLAMMNHSPSDYLIMEPA
jgi:hypothetical protein